MRLGNHAAVGIVAFLALSSTATAQPGPATLTLGYNQACYQPGQPVIVTLSLSGLGSEGANIDGAAGFQAFLDYDITKLSFNNLTFNTSLFGTVLENGVDTGLGTINVAAGINQIFGQTPTTTGGTVVTMVFTAVAPVPSSACSQGVAVDFRPHDPPTRVTNLSAQELLPLTLVGPGTLTVDAAAPVFDGSPTALAACYSTASAAQAAAIAAGIADHTDNCTPPNALSGSAVMSGDPCNATFAVTVMDCAGNSAPPQNYTTRVDGTSPTASSSGPIAACYPTAAAAQAAALANSSATDNCSGPLTPNVSTTGTCTASVTVTFTDGCGNVSNALVYPTRIDNTGPVASSSGPIAACYPTAAAAEAAALANSSAIDNCTGPLTPNASTSGSCTATVTVTFTDGCGNASNVLSFPTRIDNTPPMLTIPPDLSVECDESTEPGILLGVGVGGVMVYYNNNGNGENPANQAYLKAQFSYGNTNGAQFDFDNSPLTGNGLINWRSLFGGITPPSQFGLDFVLPAATMDGSVLPPPLIAYENTNSSQAGRVAAGPVIWLIGDYKDGLPNGPSSPANVDINSLLRGPTPGNPLTDIQITRYIVTQAGPIFTADVAGKLVSDNLIHWFNPATPNSPMANFGLDGEFFFEGILTYDSTGDTGTDLRDFYSGTITITANSPNTAPGFGIATDNCTLFPVVSYSDSISASGSCGPITYTINRTWTATDECGNVSSDVQTITVVDTTAPVFNVASLPNITVNADAGTCEAAGPTVNPATPTASDNCDASVTPSFVRSDGKPNLGDAYEAADSPITVLWTATDDCGNFSTLSQTVVVNALNELVVDVELGPTMVAGPITRCITFELWDCIGAGPDTVVPTTLTFTNGQALGQSVLVPCGAYTCVTARDRKHTLRRTTACNDAGTQYTASFMGDPSGGGDWLIGGNLNDDFFIDILDFGVYAGQYLAMYAPGGTTCSTAGPHADINGNGTADTADVTFILINFLKTHEANCCGAPGFLPDGSEPQPVVDISVAELIAQGLVSSAAADLNGDGRVNSEDVAAYLQGARPKVARPIEPVDPPGPGLSPGKTGDVRRPRR